MEIRDEVLLSIAVKSETDPRYEIGLSLLVDGVFISGTVTSSTVFLNSIKLGPKPGPIDSAPAVTPGRDGLPEYIHLKGVKFYAGSGQQIEERSNESLWRCRISAVAGFKLGTLHYVPARLAGTGESRLAVEHA